MTHFIFLYLGGLCSGHMPTSNMADDVVHHKSKVKSNINKVGGCYGNVLHLNMITYSIMEPSEISFQKLECIGSKLKKDFDNLICNAG